MTSPAETIELRVVEACNGKSVLEPNRKSWHHVGRVWRWCVLAASISLSDSRYVVSSC